MTTFVAMGSGTTRSLLAVRRGPPRVSASENTHVCSPDNQSAAPAVVRRVGSAYGAAGVDSRNLTAEQVRRLVATVARQRDYLCRLRDRIAMKGFPEADPLKLAVQRADAAVESLYHVLAGLEQGTPRWVAAQRGDE
jgi:hypothetical protein